MKTLLRQTNTGLYFQAPGMWTDDQSRAFDFRFRDRAVVYVQTWRLKGVELAFGFEDPQTLTTATLGQTSLHYAAP